MTERDPRRPNPAPARDDEEPTRVDGAGFGAALEAEPDAGAGDAFAATMALDAIGPGTLEDLAALGSGDVAPFAEDDVAPNERTVPMSADQVVATLERLGADVSGLRPPPAASLPRPEAQRQTVIESPDVMKQAVALAKTIPEGDLQRPPGLEPSRPSRPIARTVPERAIPTTQSVGAQPHQPMPPRHPQPGGAPLQAPPAQTPLGLIVAIAVVIVLILAGVAFVIVLAKR